MEITWYGLSCFKLSDRGVATVITDPYDQPQSGLGPLRLAADIVTISAREPGVNHLQVVQGKPYLVMGPGEYEVGGVFITGIQTGGHKDGEDPANSLYVFDFNSITVAHLGNLTRLPTKTEIEAMGTVNVALVPIGSNRGLNAARAAEVISMIEPNIVVPMHYDCPDCNIPLELLTRFLKEMGVSEIVTHPSLKVTDSTLPEETQIIVLDNQRV